MNMNKIFRVRTHDAPLTYDRLTIDSTGAFLVGELERLDPKVHEPLLAFTWSRDMPLRRDVTLGDEATSFMKSNFASPGNQGANGKHYIGQSTTQIAGVQEDIDKDTYPMFPWGIEVAYSVFDLAKAEQTGRPIDARKINDVQRIYQMEMDEVAYVGDSTIKAFGLLNQPDVTISPASGAWTIGKDIDEILADINDLLYETTISSATAVVPSKLLIPWKQFGMLVSRKVSDAANMSALEYLKKNTLSNAVNGRELEIYPCKWAMGAGASGADRMVAYTQEEDYVRMPIVPLLRTPLEYRGISHIFTYYGTFGGVQVVYPETIRYMDGI